MLWNEIRCIVNNVDIYSQRSGRRERGASGDNTGERSARADSRQEAPRDARAVPSQGRAFVREESKESDPQAQLQGQSSYRSVPRAAEPSGYSAPRVATATSRDNVGVDSNSMNRQRY